MQGRAANPKRNVQRPMSNVRCFNKSARRTNDNSVLRARPPHNAERLRLSEVGFYLFHEASPHESEAQPPVSGRDSAVRQSLTALCGGRAATVKAEPAGPLSPRLIKVQPAEVRPVPEHYRAGTVKMTSRTAKITSRTAKITSRTPKMTSRTAKITSRTAKITSRTPKIASRTPKITSRTAKIAASTPKIATRAVKITSRTEMFGTGRFWRRSTATWQWDDLIGTAASVGAWFSGLHSNRNVPTIFAAGMSFSWRPLQTF